MRAACHRLQRRTLGTNNTACSQITRRYSVKRPIKQTRTNSSLSDAKQQKHLTITFLTDVEGDGSYFDRYVNNSKVLGFQSRKPCFDQQDGNGLKLEWNLGQWDEIYFPYNREVVFLEEDGVLVYGGDVWDKGGSDLYVIRQLLSLHKRYPERVHFLMGNRDINKLRIVDELGPWCNQMENRLLPFHGGVYWLRGTNLTGDPNHATGSVPSSRAERLKWMLQMTMGSVDAFKLRKGELARERAVLVNSSSTLMTTKPQASMQVTDDEVAESYMLSCDPNYGIMNQYLSRAKLMVKFGTALFMHGAFPFSPDKNEMHFPCPWLNVETEKELIGDTDNFTAWMHKLNKFAADQISAWQQYGIGVKHGLMQQKGVWATEGGYSNSTHGGRMFGDLLQYGMNTLPDKSKNASVVYSSWMDDGMPREDMGNPCWYEFFKLNGLEVVATGHQPVGDMPWPIQICSNDDPAGRFWILPCDTSYSGDTSWVNIDGDSDQRSNLGRGSGSSGRGDEAVSETLIKICTATSSTISINLHGRLSDGTRYETENLMNDTVRDAATLGKPYSVKQLQFTDRCSGKKEGVFWVKAILGKHYFVSHGKGFDIWNTLLNPQK